MMSPIAATAARASTWRHLARAELVELRVAEDKVRVHEQEVVALICG
jgi:hypothetical protein